jgi:hypothetical protein
MALWTPAQLSSELWIDFSDTTTLFDATSGGSNVTNGVGIARAEDKSGNARHFTEGTSGNRPTWTSGVQNSLGIARYDGGDRLTNSSTSIWNFLHSTGGTVFVVVKNGTSADPQALYGWFGNNAASSASTGFLAAYDDRNNITGNTDALLSSASLSVTGQFAASTVTTAGNVIATEFRNIFTPNVFQVSAILVDADNATASNRLKIAVDGGSLVGNNERTTTPTTNNATYGMQIGTVGNNSFPLTGDYCELIIFSSLLSTTDRQLVEGYLAWKWGLEGNLPAGHPYKNAAPTLGIARPRINGGLLNNGLINRGLIR